MVKPAVAAAVGATIGGAGGFFVGVIAGQPVRALLVPSHVQAFVAQFTAQAHVSGAVAPTPLQMSYLGGYTAGGSPFLQGYLFVFSQTDMGQNDYQLFLSVIDGPASYGLELTRLDADAIDVFRNSVLFVNFPAVPLNSVTPVVGYVNVLVPK